MNLVFTRVPLPKWWYWGMDKVHNDEASIKTLSARPQSHFTLAFRLQTPGNLYLPGHLLRWYQSQELPLTSVPDISSALSCDTFPETRVLLFKLKPTCKLYSCLLQCCRYISLFPLHRQSWQTASQWILENTQLASHQLFKEDFYYYY